ncbi:MAG TPA: ATP-binding protein [Usitatibacter sp.]|nr:ATP-binding protein [Usitatibacter sp.]
MQIINRSLRRKVTMLVLATTVSALALSGLALILYDLRSYERLSTADLTTQGEVLARATAPALTFSDPRTAEKDLSVMQVRPRVRAAAVYDRDGNLFASYTQPGTAAEPFPRHAEPTGVGISRGEIQIFRPIVENGEPIGSVYLRAAYDPWTRLFDYMTIIGLVMLVSLGAATLISARLQSAVTAPVLDVARVSREVMERRDYSQRVRKTTEDEIGQLVDSFNAMLAEVGRRSDALRDADQRKDEFLATLAHELRNPLAPLRNALEILRIAGSDPEKARVAREMMARQLSQMVRLVDDLLDVSRITTGKLAVRKSVIDLQGPLRDAVETVRPFIEARNHTLQLDMPREPIPVEGDRTRLAQVFSNLLNNAAKYTMPGGRIVMSARMDAREAVVSVQDNGIGLDPASISRIFEMFMQVDRSLERSQAGLGVGLTLSRRLVDLHGGSVEAKSAGTGKGSEFVVRLPLSLARLTDGEVVVAEEAPRRAARRILLADDNVDFVTSLGELLAARGHDVRIAHDGAAALETAAEFSPDIAFVDIGMPKVHGYEVARRIRAEPGTASCVLVAVTGWGQENDRRRAREAGFDRHLVKPVDPEEIEAILASY